MFVSGGEAFGQANHAVLQLRALEIADPVERRPFARGELADALDDRFDHVGLGGGEALAARQFLDSGVDADGEQLVGGGRRIGHDGRCPLGNVRQRI